MTFALSCRNESSCIKTTTRLKVPRPDELVRSDDCAPAVAMAAEDVIVPLQEGKMLDCPDLQDAANMADSEPKVTWLFVHGNNVIKGSMKAPRQCFC